MSRWVALNRRVAFRAVRPGKPPAVVLLGATELVGIRVDRLDWRRKLTPGVSIHAKGVQGELNSLRYAKVKSASPSSNSHQNPAE